MSDGITTTYATSVKSIEDRELASLLITYIILQKKPVSLSTLKRRDELMDEIQALVSDEEFGEDDFLNTFISRVNEGDVMLYFEMLIHIYHNWVCYKTLLQHLQPELSEIKQRMSQEDPSAVLYEKDYFIYALLESSRFKVSRKWFTITRSKKGFLVADLTEYSMQSNGFFSHEVAEYHETLIDLMPRPNLDETIFVITGICSQKHYRYD